MQITSVVLVVAVVLGWSWWSGGGAAPAAAAQPTAAPVAVAGPRLLRIQRDAPFAQRLTYARAEGSRVTAADLRVTGRVLACLREGPGGLAWQFANVELLNLWTDWERSRVDVAFGIEQTTSAQALADIRVATQERLVARLAKLVEAGTDSERDLAAAEGELGQLRIELRRQVREAETALALARRTEAAHYRQLQQHGLDPAELLAAPGRGREVDLVVAEVPEAKVAHVQAGMAAELSFLAIPELVVPAAAVALAPSILPDRRLLLVQFRIDASDRRLRPGMFAEVRLGTAAREQLLVPAAAVLHHAGKDYVFVARDGELHEAVAVELGPLLGEQVAIRSGLPTGARVVAQGAILLRPLLGDALAARTEVR